MRRGDRRRRAVGACEHRRREQRNDCDEAQPARVHASPIACRAGSRAARCAGSAPAAMASSAAPTIPPARTVHGRPMSTPRSPWSSRYELTTVPRIAGDQIADDGAEDAADEPGQAGLDEEEATDVPVARADGLQHADLAAAFSDRGEERVGDAEGGDGQRDEPDAGEHDLDDAQVAPHRLDEVLGCARGVAEPSDPGADVADAVEPVGHDEQPGVARRREAEAAVGRWMRPSRLARPRPSRATPTNCALEHLLGDDADDLGACPAAAHVDVAAPAREHPRRADLDLGTDRACRGRAVEPDASEVALGHRDLGAAPRRREPPGDDGDRQRAGAARGRSPRRCRETPRSCRAIGRARTGFDSSGTTLRTCRRRTDATERVGVDVALAPWLGIVGVERGRSRTRRRRPGSPRADPPWRAGSAPGCGPRSR